MKFGNFKELKWKQWVIKFNVMSNNNFLENLKKAVETGEFNSEAANKINEIDKLADNAKGFTDKDREKAKKLLNAQAVSEKEAVELNSAYEEKMEKIKKTDIANNRLATLIEIEEMVELTINDMINYIVEVEETFSKEKEEKCVIFDTLFNKIEEIRKKYSIFINK